MASDKNSQTDLLVRGRKGVRHPQFRCRIGCLVSQAFHFHLEIQDIIVLPETDKFGLGIVA